MDYASHSMRLLGPEALARENEDVQRSVKDSYLSMLRLIAKRTETVGNLEEEVRRLWMENRDFRMRLNAMGTDLNEQHGMSAGTGDSPTLPFMGDGKPASVLMPSGLTPRESLVPMRNAQGFDFSPSDLNLVSSWLNGHAGQQSAEIVQDDPLVIRPQTREKQPPPPSIAEVPELRVNTQEYFRQSKLLEGKSVPGVPLISRCDADELMGLDSLPDMAGDGVDLDITVLRADGITLPNGGAGHPTALRVVCQLRRQQKIKATIQTRAIDFKHDFSQWSETLVTQQVKEGDVMEFQLRGNDDSRGADKLLGHGELQSQVLMAQSAATLSVPLQGVVAGCTLHVQVTRNRASTKQWGISSTTSGSFLDSHQALVLKDGSDKAPHEEEGDWELLAVWKERPKVATKGGPVSKNAHNMSKSSIFRNEDPDIDELINTAQSEDVAVYESKSKCWRAILIHPYNRYRSVWDIASLFLVLYDMVMIPLQLFELPEDGFLTTMQWVTRIFWTMDMPASFLSGYVATDGSIEMRPSKIISRYMISWFTLDTIVVGIDWFEVVISAGGDALGFARMGKASRIFRILRMIRLLRLARMKEVFDLLIERVNSEKVVILIDVVKLILLMTGAGHLIACGFWAVGNTSSEEDWVTQYEFDDKSLGHQYIMSLRWAISQFGGGMDEVTPRTLNEGVYAIFIYLVSYWSGAVFLSILTSSMTQLYLIGSQQSQALTVLRRYLTAHGITKKLMLRVQRNAQHALTEKQKSMPEVAVDMLALASESLRKEVHFEMFAPLLGQHPFFKVYIDEKPDVMRKVCHSAMSIMAITVGDVIFTLGETDTQPKMLFLNRGRLLYEHGTGEKQLISEGQWLCEGALWVAWSTRGRLSALADGNIYCMDAKSFQDIVTQFEHVHFDPRLYAEKFVRDLNQGILESISDLENSAAANFRVNELPISGTQFMDRVGLRASRVNEFKPSAARDAEQQAQKSWVSTLFASCFGAKKAQMTERGNDDFVFRQAAEAPLSLADAEDPSNDESTAWKNSGAESPGWGTPRRSRSRSSCSEDSRSDSGQKVAPMLDDLLGNKPQMDRQHPTRTTAHMRRSVSDVMVMKSSVASGGLDGLSSGGGGDAAGGSSPQDSYAVRPPTPDQVQPTAPPHQHVAMLAMQPQQQQQQQSQRSRSREQAVPGLRQLVRASSGGSDSETELTPTDHAAAVQRPRAHRRGFGSQFGAAAPRGSDVDGRIPSRASHSGSRPSSRQSSSSSPGRRMLQRGRASQAHHARSGHHGSVTRSSQGNAQKPMWIPGLVEEEEV